MRPCGRAKSRRLQEGFCDQTCVSELKNAPRPSSRHPRQFVATLTLISFTGAGPSRVRFSNLFLLFGKIFFPLFLDDPSPLG